MILKKGQFNIKKVSTFFFVIVIFSLIARLVKIKYSFSKSNFSKKSEEFKVSKNFKFEKVTNALFVDAHSFVSAKAVLLKINPVSAKFYCSDPFFIKDCLSDSQQTNIVFFDEVKL